MRELWRTIALAPAEESHKMHDRAAAMHHGAPVLRGSYPWCAASSSSSALAPTTGVAGTGLGCPRLQPFRLGGDDVSIVELHVPDFWQPAAAFRFGPGRPLKMEYFWYFWSFV